MAAAAPAPTATADPKGGPAVARRRGITSVELAERSIYSPSDRARPGAFVMTLAFHVIVLVAVLIRWSGDQALPLQASAPLKVAQLPIASAPQPESAQGEPLPQPTRQAVPAVRKVELPQVPVTVPVLSAPPMPQPVAEPKVDPMPRRVEEASPEAPSPPAPRSQGNAPDTWEGRVLAHLEKFRRYPAAARSARQMGVVYIRFRVDREGQVLHSSISRSSGYPLLDRAALETLRRAAPLPAIPADRPDIIELSVPVEFYVR